MLVWLVRLVVMMVVMVVMVMDLQMMDTGHTFFYFIF